MKFGISAKLITMVTTIVVIAIGLVVYMAVQLFKDDAVARVQETNKETAESLAGQIGTLLHSLTDQMKIVGSTVVSSQAKGLSLESEDLLDKLLENGDDAVSFFVYRLEKGQLKEVYFAALPEAMGEFGMKLSDYKASTFPFFQKEMLAHPQALVLAGLSPAVKKPLLAVAFNSDGWIVRCDLRGESLVRMMQKYPSVTSYLVSAQGQVLIHKDPRYAAANLNVADSPLFKQMINAKVNNHQMEFTDNSGVSYLGAAKSLGWGGAIVISRIESSKALAAINHLQYRAGLITCIIIGIAFIFNFVFSNSMTRPLEMLNEATRRISDGEFDVKLEPQSHDEIGELTTAFKKMAVGLKERDQLKTTFLKFHSKEIAQKLLSGEVKLGGERKLATIFFSDIRGFTTMSETMRPDEVLGMLNEYMTEMVKIIHSHHGVVDKYVGDAIMAVWGVPDGTPEDARHAVSAALEMRQALERLNIRRKGRGLAEIHIGMGVHTGEVVAGNMGSLERLEYTVIGDTVNQAARIESATKELATDLLVSDTTAALVRQYGLDLSDPVEISVKGRHQKIRVHGVGRALAAEQKLKAVEAGWYLRTGAGEEHGPLSVEQLKAVISQVGFAVDLAQVRKDGEEAFRPLVEVTELSRRVHENPTINLAVPEVDDSAASTNIAAPITGAASPAVGIEGGDHDSSIAPDWYVYGGEESVLGPYSVADLRSAVDHGHLSRTSYVWRQGLESWIFCYEVPGFDRRPMKKVS